MKIIVSCSANGHDYVFRPSLYNLLSEVLLSTTNQEELKIQQWLNLQYVTAVDGAAFCTETRALFWECFVFFRHVHQFRSPFPQEVIEDDLPKAVQLLNTLTQQVWNEVFPNPASLYFCFASHYSVLS